MLTNYKSNLFLLKLFLSYSIKLKASIEIVAPIYKQKILSTDSDLVTDPTNILLLH